MTPQQLIPLGPGFAHYAVLLDLCCQRFGIAEPFEQAMFLAQVAHESMGLTHFSELWGPTPAQAGYSHRADLGNTRDEAVAFAQARGVDVGRFYAGHGAIQITGYDNHLAYSKYQYGDDRCARDPLMLVREPDCIMSAGWFWMRKACARLCGAGTDKDFEALTRRINGGLNGLADRQAWWSKTKHALGVN